MRKVVSDGKAFLKNWGVSPAQGYPSVSPAQGCKAMAPRTKAKAAPTEVAPAAKTEAAPPKRRAATKVAAPAAEPKAPQAPAVVAGDPFAAARAPPGTPLVVVPGAPVKPESATIKKESRGAAAPEAPTGPATALAPGGGAATAPAAAAPTVDTSAAPPKGEMERMVSSLKTAALKGAGEQLAEYQALPSRAEKRLFYYNTFLPGNPIKETSKAFKRQRESERVDADKTKDWGWVSRDFVAGKLELTRWREIPELKIQLEYSLSKMDKRVADFAHLLGENMDKHEYHFLQAVQSVVEQNKKRTVLEEDREINQETYDSALGAIDGLDSGRSITAQAGSRRASGSNRRPSPDDDSKRDPPWLAAFKKECTRNFTTQKRAAEQALSNAGQTMSIADENPGTVNSNDLLKAYVKTIKEQMKLLQKHDHAAAQFLIKYEPFSKPANEDEAKKLESAWKSAANDIKNAKTTFMSACGQMLIAVRQALGGA